MALFALALAFLSGTLAPPTAPSPDVPLASGTICIPFIGCINL